VANLSAFLLQVLAKSQAVRYFYNLISTGFSREQKAVLAGRIAYQQGLERLGRSSALLRRNIHRLEKGLIMRPRRTRFAEDYIGETLTVYQRAVQQQSLCADELKWATDVLKQYFDVVEDSAPIAEARRLFISAVQNVTLSTPQSEAFVPYAASQLPEIAISFDQLELLYRRRRSVRWFLPKEVPESLIRQAVDAASLAPSACNRQPYRFDLLSCSRDAAYVANLAMGTTGFAEQIPCLLAVIGDLSCYPAERDRHVIYIDASLASMQLMLALETLGLSSCPINWPDIEVRERKMATTLGLAPYERVVMLIAIGYADPEGGIPYSQKKKEGLLLREVRLSSKG